MFYRCVDRYHLTIVSRREEEEEKAEYCSNIVEGNIVFDAGDRAIIFPWRREQIQSGLFTLCEYTRDSKVVPTREPVARCLDSISAVCLPENTLYEEEKRNRGEQYNGINFSFIFKNIIYVYADKRTFSITVLAR